MPDEDYIVPIGKGDIKREGGDVTIIAMSAMVQQALEAAELLEQKNSGRSAGSSNHTAVG